MLLLIRVGAYALSGILLWQTLQGEAAAPGIIADSKHLVLDPGQGLVFGVCAGISNFTGLDVVFIRMIWALAAVYRGIGVGLYILAFLLMPLVP
jgi:phage shock protein C